MATALTAVNAVLRRLREAQVTDFSSAYAALILDFVNEAKREVEDAWDWTVLRNTLTITTSSGTQTYAIPLYANGYDPERWRTNDHDRRMFDSTHKSYLYPYPADKIEEYKWTTNTTNAVSVNYAVASSDGTNPTVDLYPTPNGAYTLKWPLCTPQLDLINPTDIIKVPYIPIVLGAWSRAISERGEDQGFKTTDQYILYLNSLSYYISLDAARVPDETTWSAI